MRTTAHSIIKQHATFNDDKLHNNHHESMENTIQSGITTWTKKKQNTHLVRSTKMILQSTKKILKKIYIYWIVFWWYTPMSLNSTFTLIHSTFWHRSCRDFVISSTQVTLNRGSLFIKSWHEFFFFFSLSTKVDFFMPTSIESFASLDTELFCVGVSIAKLSPCNNYMGQY